jgi:RHS repeat-associated protein
MQGNGPSTFTVKGKNGLSYQYGNGGNSQILLGTTAVGWMLNQVSDRAGNTMTISYCPVTPNCPTSSNLQGMTLPATISWTPSSHGSSVYNDTIQFNYGTVSSAPTTGYVAGSPVMNMYLLNNIQVQSSGTTVRNYVLGYTASTSTGRQTLTSFTECADSGATNCLSPTIVGYQSGTAGIANPTSTNGSTTNSSIAYTADIDGNGKQDLVYVVVNTSNNTWHYWVQFSTGTGYGAPVDTGIVTGISVPFLIDNFDGGSANEFLTPVSGIWYAYKWNPGTGTFNATSTGIAVLSGVSYACADIDGDGLADLVYSYAAADGSAVYIAAQLNTTTGSSVSFGTSAVVGTLATTSAVVGGLAGDNAGLPTPLKRMDFDGDGRSDLLVTIQFSRPSHFTRVVEVLSRGTSPAVFSAEFAVGSGIAGVIPVNWNDDACTDLVFGSGNGNAVLVSECNGAASQIVTLPASPLVALDWDGDGRTDVLVPLGNVLQVYRSTGNGVAAAVSTGINAPSSYFFYLPVDLDGDGLDDIVFAGGTGVIDYGLHNGSGLPPDLATSFVDGYGNSHSPNFVSIADSGGVYTVGSVSPPATYAVRTNPLYVVASDTASDGIGGSYNIDYTYSGAITNLQGRGFQGFTTRQTHDSRTLIFDAKTYSTIFPTSNMLTAETVTQNDGTNISNAIYTPVTLTLDASTGRFFPYIASSSANTYEVQIGGAYNGKLIRTTAVNFGTPDSYGNFPNVTTTLTDEDSGSLYFTEQWSTTVAQTIAPDHGTNWCLSLPTEIDITKTAPGVPNITRHVTFVSPDYVNCRQTEAVVESGNPTYQVDTKFAYLDAFGNMTGHTVTGVGMTPRTTTMAWGTTGQFPITVTNALSQTTHTNFDSITGKPLSISDPNGIGSSWQYDPFGRPIKETHPNGLSTNWAYNSCTSAGCVNGNNVMTVVTTGDVIENTYLDRLDRVLVDSTPLVTGAFNKIETQYDNLGRAHLRGMPCMFVGCTQYWTTNTYDILNRVTSSQRPISSSNSNPQTTGFSYQGQTTITTDPQSKVRTRFNLPTGAVGRTQDANGFYVNFKYDAFGAVLSVTDSEGSALQTITYDYGISAFPKTLSDIDGGSWGFTHDALGELTTYTDSKNQSFSMSYDALSRRESRVDPDLTTTWTWGISAASHNIGQLASVSSVSPTGGTYSETYTYDSAGRLSDRQFNIPTIGALAFDYTYNSTNGLLATLTYPASFPSATRVSASYLYQFGNLFVIEDAANPSTVWYRGSTQNARGQYTGEATEDSASDLAIKSTRTYDAVTGWLTSVTAGAGTGNALQNEAYLYDEVGNVTQRQNNNVGLTENFSYDNDYRLSTSHLQGNLNLSMTYDLNGNITRRSDVASGGLWTYDPIHKHQVTQAGSSAFTYTYDANGNVSSRNGSLIGWTSYNYPNGISSSTESATFEYGPDRQRWRMVYSGAGGTETTYYASPQFEAVFTSAGTDYRHYIYANGKPVMVISRTTTGAVNVRSLLTDQQGSISTIVNDATGAAYAMESFTAFGNRREASTWTGTPTSGERTTMDGATREGYTFQTVLGSMGLNHMNGRVEDAVTGRFLSPDPYVSQPDETQGWNRYSYVNNNPLTYNDPSGFCLGLGDPDDCDNSGGGETVVPPPPDDGGILDAPLPTTGDTPAINFDPTPVQVNGSCTGIGETCYYNPDSFMQSPGVNTAPGLPIITVTAPRPQPTKPQQLSTSQSLLNMLCHGGNSLAARSEQLGDYSTKIELAGLAVTAAGTVTAQPEFAAGGLTMASAGGYGSIAAGALQLGAGLMQGFGGGGFGNFYSSVLTLGTSASLGRVITGPGASGYRTVSQRATDNFLNNSATVTGGIFDAMVNFVAELAPHQVSCPGDF